MKENLTKTEIKNYIWKLLEEGLTLKDSPLKTPVFSNIENNKPSAKIVVLRAIDRKKRTLTFHTDYRSPKVKALKKNANAVLVFYHKDEKVQLKITVKTKIHFDDKIAAAAWKNTAHYSRKCYLIESPPSAVIKSPGTTLPINFEENSYTLEQSELGYKNFAVVECFINSIDWLYLASTGHKRAIFSYYESEEFNWLVP
jgi:pyridoxamine 5'-phosphate oxidase